MKIIKEYFAFKMVGRLNNIYLHIYMILSLCVLGFCENDNSIRYSVRLMWFCETKSNAAFVKLICNLQAV